MRKPKPKTRAEVNIDWIEEWCRIPEGKDVGKPVRLREWQKDILRRIYDNPHGTRRAIISFGKKNAKTSMAAFLVLLHLCGPESQPNSQLPSTAQSKEQAGTLFKLAAKIVRMNPALDAQSGGVVVIRDTIKELYCPDRGTLYKALSAEDKTAHGQSPVFAVHDELGQVKGPVSLLFNAIENAMGAHEEPLSIIISTQAPTDDDLLSVLIDDAKTGADPKVVLSLYTADEELDPFSEEAIRAANPAFGDFLNAREVKAQAADAQRMPSQEALYRNYVLNQRVDTSSPFVNRAAWSACAGTVVEDWEGRTVYAGLDLAKAAEDMTALVLVTPVEGEWHARAHYWLPWKGLAEKSRSDRVPYDVWHREGWLEVTPGTAVDYDHVAQRIAEILGEVDARTVAYDPYNWTHMRPALIRAGVPADDLPEPREQVKEGALFRPFRQGIITMSPALTNLEAAILDRKLVHDGHPVLTMNSYNATVERDRAGNRMLSKIKSRGRIDGMVALAMAMSVAGTWEDTGPTGSVDDYFAALGSAA